MVKTKLKHWDSALDKKKAQKCHALRRFQERHGLSFNSKIEAIFIKMIQTNMATFVERKSNRLTVWDVPYNLKIFRVFYDRDRKTVATVLPDKDRRRKSKCSKRMHDIVVKHFREKIKG